MPTARAADCPRERLIVDFSRGKLDDAAAETVSAHLETCVDCRAAVDGVSADSFIQRLRAAHGQIPAAPAPAQNSEADSVSRADSATVALKLAAAQVSPPESAKFSLPIELVDHPDYELIKELGRGGMGVVYLARNRAMDRLEVLKVVSKSLVEQPGARERFQREIRSAAKLSHPNIVAAYSVPRAGDLLIFAMEHVAGQDLSQVVKQRGPLPVVNAAYYAHQVALGLQHAHEQRMVHRDIKPNNLILSVQAKRHLVKILDFGLAKATSEKLSSSELTGSGQMLGTPDYMAPEQSLDAHEADNRADIYSLGCTLYYMLAGRAPFQGASMYAVLSAHHSNTARLLSDVRNDVPAELAAVVAKMMAKDPADRYQTPADVSQALGPFYRAASGEAAKLTPMTEVTVSREIPVDVFDPYYQWLGIAPEEQPVDHYRLLGAKCFEANLEVIANLADQRMAHLRTFQDGQHSALSRKLLDEVATARVCLLKADRKAAYDAELRRSIAAQPQALPPIAVSLAPPLAAVEAPETAPPELSLARKAAARAKRAMASLSTRLGVDRLPPAVRYTALGSLAALIVLCVVVIKLSTPDGELTVEVNKLNAEVATDGQKATVGWDNDSKRAEISVPAGKHKVEVTKDGVTASGQEVSIEQNGSKVLTAKLEPPAKSTPVQAPADGTESVHQGNKPWESAAFQQWMKDVAATPAEQQVEAVAMKLRELNPDYAGKETHTIERGAVTAFSFVADDVADISPIRALAGLAALGCSGSGSMRRGVALSDLSPLRGMRLAKLECISTNVGDLSPLKGMPLTTLNVAYTRVADLSALKGMQLTDFACGGTPVSDLSPLEGMPITRLNFVITDVTDLSPLRGMPVRVLFFGKTGVADLSPLKGMPLDSLDCTGVRVSDLSPLAGMKLRELRFTPAKITKGIDVIRQMESLTSFGVGYPIQRLVKPDEFWKKYDAGEFGKPDDPGATTDQKAAMANPNTKGPPKLVPAAATSDSPSKPFRFPLDQWVDLLPMVDTTANAVRGDWVRDGTEITVAQADVSALSPPVSLEGSYDFEVSFKRTEGDGAIAAMVSIDSHPCSIILSGWQGRASGLMNLDGRPPNDATNPIALRPAPLKNGRSYKLLASVRIYSKHHASLEVLLDSAPYLPRWEGDPSALSAEATWALPDPKHLGLGARCEAKFYSARLRMVSPFEQWLKDVAAQPPSAAAKSVEGKLSELNPGFHGTVSHQVRNGVVYSFDVTGDGVVDISPVKALIGLNDFSCYSRQLSDLSPLRGSRLSSLSCWGISVSDLTPIEGMPLTSLACRGKALADLSPLRGMHLTHLFCENSNVSDLSPLKGMPLRGLSIDGTPVSDISPLEGMPLNSFSCSGTRMTDLSPLKGMPLATLNCSGTAVPSLSPLEGMRLNSLSCDRTKVTDLSPLAGMHLTSLYCTETTVSDLTPLKGMSLTEIGIPVANINKGMDILRQMKTLKWIGDGKPHSTRLRAEAFWRKYDAGALK